MKYGNVHSHDTRNSKSQLSSRFKDLERRGEKGKKEQILVVRPPTVQPNKKYTEEGSERGNFNPRCVYENE